MSGRIDGWLILAAVSIFGASLANLYAVSPAVGRGLFLRQAVFGGVAVVLFWICSSIRVTAWQQASPIFYGVGLALLVAVLFVGEVRSGTRAWFVVGPLSLQPSEFARVATMLLVAAHIGGRGEPRLGRSGTTGLMLIILAPVALIWAEPDLGVALTYTPIFAAGLWLGGVSARVWMILVLLAVVGVGVGWTTVLKPYQKDRVLTVFNPDRDPYGAGYQARQSRIAVGSGGAAGQGLGKGSQSVLKFLPAQHTDFAFAAWAEATGFVGATGLLMAFALLIWRLGVIALGAESRFGLVLAMTVSAWFAFQVVVNLGMVMGWLPTAGVTLPLFSYGGSSLLSTVAALGIVHSVWRFRLVN
jgi:rod shape determining protein RodA